MSLEGVTPSTEECLVNGYPYIRESTYNFINDNFIPEDVDIIRGVCLVGKRISDKDGYIVIYYRGKVTREHHIISYFIFGHRMVGKQVNHLNLDRSDNRPLNLELCTGSENVRHSFASGLRKNNYGNGSNLNEVDIVSIRKRKRNGETLKSIADDYGVAFQTISKICNYTRWAHVPDDPDLVGVDFDKYQELAMRTVDPSQCDYDEVCNYSLGLVCEAGEVADIVKKQLFHGHEVDSTDIKDELGDTLWYLANLARKYNLSMKDIAVSNLQKLKLRYPEGFSPQSSINRVV